MSHENENGMCLFDGDDDDDDNEYNTDGDDDNDDGDNDKGGPMTVPPSSTSRVPVRGEGFFFTFSPFKHHHNGIIRLTF